MNRHRRTHETDHEGNSQDVISDDEDQFGVSSAQPAALSESAVFPIFAMQPPMLPST